MLNKYLKNKEYIDKQLKSKALLMQLENPVLNLNNFVKDSIKLYCFWSIILEDFFREKQICFQESNILIDNARLYIEYILEEKYVIKVELCNHYQISIDDKGCTIFIDKKYSKEKNINEALENAILNVILEDYFDS